MRFGYYFKEMVSLEVLSGKIVALCVAFVILL